MTNNAQPNVIYDGNIKYDSRNNTYTLEGELSDDAYKKIIDNSIEIYLMKSNEMIQLIKHPVGGKRRKHKLQKRTKKRKGGKGGKGGKRSKKTQTKRRRM